MSAETEIIGKSRLNDYYGIDENDVESFAAEIDGQNPTEIVLSKRFGCGAMQRVSDKLNRGLNEWGILFERICR